MLLAVVGLLVGLGILMVLDVTYFYGWELYGDPLRFFRMHLISVATGVVALIVGRAAPEGARMGHAGAIIEGEEGTAASKIQALADAGARIAYRPSEIPLRIRELGV